MSNSLYPTIPEGTVLNGSLEIVHDPNQSVTARAPPSSTMKHKADNDKRIKKRLMFKVSAVQFLMGASAITTQIIYDAHYAGTGMWWVCYLMGNFFVALAGIFGMFTSITPSLLSVVTSMVMSTIALIICISLLVDQRIFSNVKMKTILFTIQYIIGLIQAGVSIASIVMTCKYMCNFCRHKSRRENCPNSNIEESDETNQFRENPQITFTSKPARYVPMPITEIHRVPGFNVDKETSTDMFISDDVSDEERIDFQLQYYPSAPPAYYEIAMYEQN